MKTGIELIAIERQEQIEKHGYDAEFVKSNPKYYDEMQLARAAEMLLSHQHTDNIKRYCYPTRWPVSDANKMLRKSYKERLIIAGALIAAEIDRLNSL